MNKYDAFSSAHGWGPRSVIAFPWSSRSPPSLWIYNNFIINNVHFLLGFKVSISEMILSKQKDLSFCAILFSMFYLLFPAKLFSPLRETKLHNYRMYPHADIKKQYRCKTWFKTLSETVKNNCCASITFNYTLQEHQTIPTNATVSTDSDIENALWSMRKIEF